MLKNNKGYFLAETIIVLTVVALAITTLYVNSMESYVKEKNELTKYNTVDGLYSANAVKKYLYKYVNDFKVNANINGYIDVNNYLNGQSIKVNNVTFFKELNVKQLYFSTYDMTKLISSGVLKKNIQKELSNIENDSKCTYRYIVIYNDYSYSLVGVSCGEEEEEIQTIAKFNYTGSEQTYIAPADGYYNLEVWGAQGDVVADTGFGGYSAGNIKLNKGDILYVVVGQKGQYSGIGGYNGGGTGSRNNDSTYGYSTGGGGATHIASVKGTLSSIGAGNKDKVYIVSGGGGGHSGYNNNGSGGSAGGYIGNIGTGQTATGGSQTSGGSGSSSTAGNFGLGGSIILGTHSAGGGGSGFYGGGATGNGGGAGGSGYIGNSLLTNKVMYCYKCNESSDISTKTVSTTNVSANPISKSAKKGNGYAKISYCGYDRSSCNSN